MTVGAQVGPPENPRGSGPRTDPRRHYTDPEFDADEQDRAEPQIDPAGDIP